MCLNQKLMISQVLKTLVLVDELENNFNVKFTIEEIADVQNVGDIKRHIKNHNIDLDE